MDNAEEALPTCPQLNRNQSAFIMGLEQAGAPSGQITHRFPRGGFSPKGTPKLILDKLAEALDKTLDDDNSRKRLLDLGVEIPDKASRGQQPLAALVKSEIARWTPIIKGANISTRALPIPR